MRDTGRREQNCNDSIKYLGVLVSCYGPSGAVRHCGVVSEAKHGWQHRHVQGNDVGSISAGLYPSLSRMGGTVRAITGPIEPITME